MKDKIITIAFIIIICGMFLVNLFVKDTEISTLERRKLAQFPEITLERIVNRKWIDDFENYTQDQFFGRDIFMDIKSFWSLNIFRQKDDNKMFVKDNAIYKMEYPLNTNNLLKNIGKIKGVCDKHLKDNKIYFSIIPEKNYYLENNDYLLMDYEKIENMMKDNLKDLEYINIFDELRLEDYYKTDVHCKQ